MLEWCNGSHEGLKIPWSLRPCGFESRFEHNAPHAAAPQLRFFVKYQKIPNFVAVGTHGP